MTSLFLIIGVVAIMLAANIAVNKLPERLYVTMSLIFTVGFVAIGFGFGLNFADLGLARSTWVSGALWAGLAIGGVALVYFVGAAFRPTRALFADDRATEVPGKQVARRALIDIPFGTVALEEAVFRGVLYGMLATRFGDLWAIIGTSVLFGLWHVLPAIPMLDSHRAVASVVGHGRTGRAITVIGTVFGTGAAGIVFAGLRWWTGSLLPAVGLHWALNGLGLAVAWGLARATHSNRAEAALDQQVEEAESHLLALRSDHESESEPDSEAGP